MKKLLLLFILLPCLSWAQVTYSGVSILSIMTTGDIPPVITVSAGCMFSGVSSDQANQLGLMSVGQDSSTGSIVTTYNGYNPQTQQAFILIPNQTFTLPNDGLASNQYITSIQNYVAKRYKIYADQITSTFFTTPKPTSSINLNSSVSPQYQVEKSDEEHYSSTPVKQNEGKNIVLWDGKIAALQK